MDLRQVWATEQGPVSKRQTNFWNSHQLRKHLLNTVVKFGALYIHICKEKGRYRKRKAWNAGQPVHSSSRSGEGRWKTSMQFSISVAVYDKHWFVIKALLI